MESGKRLALLLHPVHLLHDTGAGTVSALLDSVRELAGAAHSQSSPRVHLPPFPPLRKFEPGWLYFQALRTHSQDR